MAFPDSPRESWIVYDEEFRKDQFNRAFDVFMRELMNLQSWIVIAESRAALILTKKTLLSALSADGSQKQ